MLFLGDAWKVGRDFLFISFCIVKILILKANAFHLEGFFLYFKKSNSVRLNLICQIELSLVSINFE